MFWLRLAERSLGLLTAGGRPDSAHCRIRMREQLTYTYQYPLVCCLPVTRFPRRYSASAAASFRMSEALEAGLNRRSLYALRDAGTITQLSRGVYRLASLPELEAPDLVTVATRVPAGVVCLISALAYHELTHPDPACCRHCATSRRRETTHRLPRPSASTGSQVLRSRVASRRARSTVESSESTAPRKASQMPRDAPVSGGGDMTQDCRAARAVRARRHFRANYDALHATVRLDVGRSCRQR